MSSSGATANSPGVPGGGGGRYCTHSDVRSHWEVFPTKKCENPRPCTHSSVRGDYGPTFQDQEICADSISAGRT
ncbi:hypothetical protein PGQ11_003332 [Apiospora arundinis]|uniref:Uncharacterized protein n=1 Tax=Apiospora arundinis TaxID=335852 RepID=A0ABR2J4W0_9PEZI